MPGAEPKRAYDAVVFDLLTALIDSWSLWNDVAGSPERGLAWRTAYLKLTYEAGAYRDYMGIVAEAADVARLERSNADALAARWGELHAWPEAPGVLEALAARAKLGVVTNCSVDLGHAAANDVSPHFDAVITAEEAGYYKPLRQPYADVVEALGVSPARTLFVAGSAADVPGASALGMPVYWHNRISVAPVGMVSPLHHERSLDRLLEIV